MMESAILGPMPVKALWIISRKKSRSSAVAKP